MNFKTTFSLLGIACISCYAFAQDHPSDHPTDHPKPTPDSVPATPLVKPKPAPKAVERPAPTPLYIGDDAPSITIDHWVKGDSFDNFEDGQVYVVEFWATWCGPCVSSMPHLSGIQEEYGNTVKVVGVSSEKELNTVTEFLKKINTRDNTLNNDRMRYTVAVDPDRTMSESWMRASGQRGIPTAFIVDSNNKVAWIGHPMKMDEPLSEIVEGTWDITSARQEFMAEAVGERAMAELQKTYREKMETEDWDGWIAAIDAYTKEYGGSTSLTNMKFESLLFGKKDTAAAYALAEEIAADNWGDANALNALSWGIVDETPDELRDIEFALKVATRANQLTKSQDPMILDTLARVYWERGDVYKAIAWQSNAVRHLEEDGPMADSIQATLDEYKATLANVGND